MDRETFNFGTRKFLEAVGVGAQQAFEQVGANALAAGNIAGGATLAVTMTLQIAALRTDVRFDGEVKLR